MTKFPRVVQAMNKFDHCTVLHEICVPGVTDMNLVLQKAELKIEDIKNLSFLEIVKLQGELEAKPPPYAVIREALQELQDNYVIRKRAELEAVVREELLKKISLKDSQKKLKDDSVVSSYNAMSTRVRVTSMETWVEN